MSDHATTASNAKTVLTDIVAELAKLRAENAQLKADKIKSGPFGLKVTEKGGVSVYGMGRFPVTLYGEQWERLLARKDEILQFLADNADRLSKKGD